MFLGTALVLSFLEAVLPVSFLPGFKPGLANIAVLACTYAVGLADGGTVALLRCLITALLFGSGTSMLFSFTGMLSVLAVLVLLRFLHPVLKTRLSFIGISILTALAHNLGQLACAALLYGWGLEILTTYGGILLTAGVFCGMLTGFLTNLLFSRLWDHRKHLGRI